MTHHLHTIGTFILIILCKQSTISRMNKTQKYSLTQHHHTWLLKYFHETSKAQLISNLIDFNQLGWLPMHLFEKNYWWSFKLGLILWSFEQIWFVHELNLQFVVSQIFWKNKTWVPICKKLEKKSSWTKKIYGHPFAKNLKKKFHDKCNTQAINSFRQDRLLGEGLPIF